MSSPAAKISIGSHPVGGRQRPDLRLVAGPSSPQQTAAVVTIGAAPFRLASLAAKTAMPSGVGPPPPLDVQRARILGIGVVTEGRISQFFKVLSQVTEVGMPPPYVYVDDEGLVAEWSFPGHEVSLHSEAPEGLWAHVSDMKADTYKERHLATDGSGPAEFVGWVQDLVTPR
jgi:hypothetical protein